LFRHTARILGGQNPERKTHFPFSEKIGRAQIKNVRSGFSFGVAEALRGGGGTIRAYDLVSLHHALRACDIICFENRCELGTIETLNVGVSRFVKNFAGLTRSKSH